METYPHFLFLLLVGGLQYPVSVSSSIVLRIGTKVDITSVVMGLKFLLAVRFGRFCGEKTGLHFGFLIKVL